MGPPVADREEGLAQLPGMLLISEPALVAGPVFGRIELAFAYDIVIADPGLRGAVLDTESQQQVSKVMSGHR